MSDKNNSAAEAVLTLVHELSVLKNLPRSGWRIRGLKDCESVADHCFRMSALAMILSDMLAQTGVKIDTARVMRMALLHEFAESRVGDIPFPAMRHIPHEVKRTAEQEAIEAMVAGLGSLGEEYLKLWLEFEEGDSLEGQLVRAADKLEMMIQAAEYEAIGYQSLSDFWLNTANMKDFAVHPMIGEIMALLVARRLEKK